MKRFLLVFTGLLVGFAAGSWTPLGDFGSLGNVKSLALKSDRLSALVGAPAQNGTAPRQIRSEFLPYLSMARSLHASTLSLERSNEMIQLLTGSLKGPSTQGRKGIPALGQNAIFADSPNAELTSVIGALEAENQQIALYLASQSSSEPEYHLTRSIYQSNNQWLETLRFMVQKNNGNISAASAGSVTPLLESLRQKVEESTFLGRRLVLQNVQELAGLNTISAEERAFKDMLISFIESYDTSYEIEETLASLVVDYPQLVSQSGSGHNMSNEIAAWDRQTLDLVTDRMELKQFRQTMAMNLSAPGS